MRKRFIYGSGLLLLAFLFTLLIWQGSFSFGEYAPASPEQTYAVWAVSTLIFLLTVTLGFMLVRNFVKLYIERQSNREGSRIRTKLVVGAVALSWVPVFFSVLFSVYVLNRNLEKWFTRPAENIKVDLITIAKEIERAHHDKLLAQAETLASVPDALAPSVCAQRGFTRVALGPHVICSNPAQPGGREDTVTVAITGGALHVSRRLPIDLDHIRGEIEREVREYDQLTVEKKTLRWNYLQLLTLITLFIFFFATWIALFLAKQISIPIAALLGGAQQVRRGNLAHRVEVQAIDELATLVHAFNDMTAGLEANSLELDKRRRFIEAILESIPTGVISLTADGRILLTNRALKGMFAAGQLEAATRLDDLFPADDAREIRYLMNRARRVGIAAEQFELRTGDRKGTPLSITVAALEQKGEPGFVIVLEDTSDLLRAQKFAAWHEIARRIAHEIKNPLTPIALCAERIARQLERRSSGTDTDHILRECAELISTEVESLKSLVNEFSQFARFPAAQPTRSDLNEVVESAIDVFQGRLHGIDIRKSLMPDLPAVNIDREQFKRLIINLVDNAAEAMESTVLKRLYIGTTTAGPDSVELIVADTGCGVSSEDKEKLFLPYFSTKGRGTGLGLAIVNHIVSDHNAHIRVEDNYPTGARFIVEIAAAAVNAAADVKVQETPA
jgi:two-component system, NtrC family, nitrogen regulation sensor histidine kinase NtrY